MDELLEGPRARLQLPGSLIETTTAWLNRISREDLLIYICECYPVAQTHDLVDPIIQYGDYFCDDDEVTDGQGPRAFRQGMLFGLAVAFDWLHDEDWDINEDAVTTIDNHIKELSGVLGDDDTVTRPDDVLLRFGDEGLDEVEGFRKLIETAGWKIEPEADRLHPYLLAGAGLMLRIILEARKAAGVTTRGDELLSLPELRVFQISGGLAIRSSDDPLAN